MGKVLVLGASGGIGYALVQQFIAKGIDVVAFARRKEKLLSLYAAEPKVTIFSGDALNEDNVMKAAVGVDVIVHAVSFPYEEWQGTHPQLIEIIIRVAKAQQANIALVDNIYAYGRQSQDKVTEKALKNPHTKKGKIRLAMENRLQHCEVPSLIVHMPDLYGPNAENTLLHETLKDVRRNKKANFVGPKNTPREFLFTFDGAKAMVELTLREDAYNQNWNIPAVHPITVEELADLFREELQYTESIRPVTKSMIRFIGIFQPFMREMVEMMYLTEEPIILSGEKYAKEVGSIPSTSYQEGIRETLRWMHENL